jgi:hypothetical protein
MELRPETAGIRSIASAGAKPMCPKQVPWQIQRARTAVWIIVQRRATRGRPEVGLAVRDKLNRTLGRRSASKKATG